MNKEDVLSLFKVADIQLETTKLDDHKPLTQQGLDSLDFANLIFQVETKYDLTISPEEASQLRTIQNLVDYVGERSAAE